MREDPRAPGYFLTEDGAVIGPSGRQLKLQANNGDGYLCFNASLGSRSKRIRRSVHVAMCEAYHGDKPGPKYVARHLNDDHLDNRSANIAWGTYADNTADSIRNGTFCMGERHHRAVLTESDVARIKRLLDEGDLTQREIAEVYSVSRSCVYHISTGKNWSHVMRERAC